MTMPPIPTNVDCPRIPMSPIPSTAPPSVLVDVSNFCTFRTTGTDPPTRLANMWHRSKAKINRLLGNADPQVCAARDYPHPFPYEITEMIIAYLIYDLHTLKACSLTCRSWYIIASPHIHRTLVLGRGFTRNGPKPLSKLYGLGLIPFVQELRVERPPSGDGWFVPRAFSRRSLCYFSAFANVHTLGLEGVEICRFILHLQRYFGQFSPTLRSIVLSEPRCTPRQLSHFLSFFPILDDIKIRGPCTRVVDTANPDAMLVPFSAPKLRGRLVLSWFDYTETLTHLIASCDGLRFRRMELRESVSCVPAMLEACAETLETLRLYARDRWRRAGPTVFPVCDLSRLKVLRSLQIADWVSSSYPPWGGGYAAAIVTEVFSTITSPNFSRLVVVLSGVGIYNLPHALMLFQTLRKMHEVRHFELVFLFEGPHTIQKGGQRGLVDGRQELKEALDHVAAKGFLDFLDSPPTIQTTPRTYLHHWNFSEFD